MDKLLLERAGVPALALSYREPLAPALIERERLDGGLLGTPFVGRLHNTEKFGALAQDRDAPVASFVAVAFFLGDRIISSTGPSLAQVEGAHCQSLCGGPRQPQGCISSVRL
jgi:hypothetical protein